MNSVDKVNKLSKSDFLSIFGNVFEKTTWIAEKVFTFKPFENYEELLNKFLNIFEKERTIIIISHRMSALSKCEKIFQLSNKGLKQIK